MVVLRQHMTIEYWMHSYNTDHRRQTPRTSTSLPPVVMGLRQFITTGAASGPLRLPPWLIVPRNNHHVPATAPLQRTDLLFVYLQIWKALLWSPNVTSCIVGSKRLKYSLVFELMLLLNFRILLLYRPMLSFFQERIYLNYYRWLFSITSDITT